MSQKLLYEYLENIDLSHNKKRVIIMTVVLLIEFSEKILGDTKITM